MVNSGMGVSHVNSFLTGLNLPGIHHKSMKAREREVGRAVKTVARESCNKALQEGIERSMGKGLVVSGDGGWSKRGRTNDSDTGYGGLIDVETDKCVDYSVRSKRCRRCETGQTNIPHECGRNWQGSSKAMEPDMIVEMLHNVEDRGAKVTTLVMDNDSTTIARARKDFPDLKKQSDRNHSMKNINSNLYTLRGKHGPLKNDKTLKYIKKLIACAIDQHQNNPDGMATRLGEIVAHIYGEHAHCSHEW